MIIINYACSPRSCSRVSGQSLVTETGCRPRNVSLPATLNIQCEVREKAQVLTRCLSTIASSTLSRESSSNSFNYPLQGIRLQAPRQCQLREHGTHGTVRRSIRASHFFYSSQSKALPQSSHEIRLSWMVNDRQGSTQESISGRQNTRNHGDTELLRLHGSSRS